MRQGQAGVVIHSLALNPRGLKRFFRHCPVPGQSVGTAKAKGAEKEVDKEGKGATQQHP